MSHLVPGRHCSRTRGLIAAAAFAALAPAHAQTAARPELGPDDFAKCSAAAEQKMQLLRETQSLFPDRQIDTAPTLRQMKDYFRISCTFSSANFAYDRFELSQKAYVAGIPQVVERCKVSNA